MTSEHRPPAAPTPSRDAIDADFVTLGDSATRTGLRPNVAMPVQAASPAGMASLARDEGTAESRKGGPVFWLFGFVLVAGAFWISGGHALAPQRAATPALHTGEALRIVDLTTRVDPGDGRATLLVDGEALNDGAEPKPLPAISIAVTDKSGATTRYRMGTDGRTLGAGQRYPFSSRLRVPAEGVSSVSVTFADD